MSKTKQGIRTAVLDDHVRLLKEARITAHWLAKEGACLRQRKIFAAEWPEGVTLSRRMLLRAAAIGLTVEWAGWFLKCQEFKRLSEEGREKTSKWSEEVYDIRLDHDGGRITNAQFKKKMGTVQRKIQGAYARVLADILGV